MMLARLFLALSAVFMLSSSAFADWEKNSFALSYADGTPVSSAEFEGKLTFVNIWATWCSPCMKGLPAAAPLYEANKNNPNVSVLSVHYKSRYGRFDSAAAFLASKNLSYPVIHDTAGKFTKKIDNIPFVTSVPHYVLIGPKGRILKRYNGLTAANLKDIQARFDAFVPPPIP